MKHAVLSTFAVLLAASLTSGCSTTSFNQGFATVQNGFKTVEISTAPSLKGKATFTDLRFEAPYTIKGSITYPRSCAVLTVEGRLYDEKNKSYAFTKGIMDYRKDEVASFSAVPTELMRDRMGSGIFDGLINDKLSKAVIDRVTCV